MPAKLLLQILMAFFIQSAILSLEFSYVTKDLVVDHFDDMKGIHDRNCVWEILIHIGGVGTIHIRDEIFDLLSFSERDG